MPSDRYCCVPGCYNRTPYHHLHGFPSNAERRKMWLANIGCETLKKLTASQLCYRNICHAHFEQTHHGNQCRTLKKTAVPTIFPVVTSDHSDIESLSPEDGQSDGECGGTSPIHQDAEETDQVGTHEGMLSDTVEGVLQPFIASMADEYESMCMEIIGDLPEYPKPLQETSLKTKVENYTQASQPIPPPISAIEALKRKEARHTIQPTWRPPEDVFNEEYFAAAVINTGHPLGHLSESTEVLLRDHLYQLLDEASQNNNDNFNLPQFLGWSYHDGIFQVRCADSQARHWLAQAVSLVPGEKFSVVSVHVPARLVRASIWVPGDTAPTTEIKQRLDSYAARQGLDTSGWRILQHTSKQKPKGTLLILGMPAADVVRVKEKGRRIMYRLDSLRVNFMDENQGREEEPSSSTASKVPPR